MVFLLDSAGSIHLERWQNLTNFAADIVRQLDVHPNRTRVGLIYWSDSAFVAFHLNQYPTRQDVIQAITYAPYLGGKTNTAAGLQLLRETAFQEATGDRSYAKNIAILVANQESTVDQKATVAEAIKCRLAGIKMMVVRIENRLQNSIEMETIASLPRSSNLFFVSKLSQLPSIVNSVVSETCNSEQLSLNQSIDELFDELIEQSVCELVSQ